MEKAAEPKLVLPPINQIGIVVEDVEKTAEHYYSTLGIGPFVINDNYFQRATLYGEPAPTKLRFAIARKGAIEIELIQVLEGGKFYSELLRSRGEGLHHLGSYMKDLDAYDRKVAEVISHGFRPTFQYRGRSLKFTYFDTQAIGGVIFELIHLEGRELP